MNYTLIKHNTTSTLIKFNNSISLPLKRQVVFKKFCFILECQQDTPQPIVCMPGQEKSVYYSYNGGECRRMYGCFSVLSRNLYEDEEECIKDWENC